MRFLKEIKERRLIQFMGAYMATGFVALEGMDQLVSYEVVPEVAYLITLVFYVFGVPASAIFAWFHGAPGDQKAPLREVVMLTVVGVMALSVSGFLVRDAMQEATLQNALVESGVDLRRIGVLYFEDMSADGSMQPVAERITEGLISQLSEVGELDVSSRNAARAVRDLEIDEDSIASILDVGTLVDGTVNQVGDELQISVRVIEGESGVPLFRDSYRWPADQVASVDNELAREVGVALREQLGVEVRLREREAEAPNPEAWLHVARAERLMKEADEALDRGDGQAMWDAYESAEAELIEAQRAAPEWAEPLALRSEIAYERWQLTATAEEEIETLAEAVDLADSALALEPDNPDALEWRGTALYRRWLLQMDDEETLDAMFTTAQNDLERSKRLDEGRASVNATLSHLYYQVDDWAQAVLAAREAYQQDAFLTSIDQVIRRLYQASYDIGQYREARDWCMEGHRRFPDNFRFVQCQIYVMTMPGAEPDISEAWRLYDQMVSLMPEGGQTELIQAITRTFIGGVIGQAGLADSADAVFRRARVEPEADPTSEQKSMEAAMRAVMGDVEGAVERLQVFMIEQPGHFPGRHWWWDNLEGDPAFERLQAQG